MLINIQDDVIKINNLKLLNELLMDRTTGANRAIQATYGYEFQGDNLLIARINIFMTFIEYLWARWNREPDIKEYRKPARYISWNVWQMDGLTGTIPYCKTADEFQQMNLFEWMEEETDKRKNLRPKCRIYNKYLEFKTITGRN